MEGRRGCPRGSLGLWTPGGPSTGVCSTPLDTPSSVPGREHEVTWVLLWGLCRGPHAQALPSASSSTAAQPQRPTLWGCTHSHTCTHLRAPRHNAQAHTQMSLTPLVELTCTHTHTTSHLLVFTACTGLQVLAGFPSAGLSPATLPGRLFNHILMVR